MYHALGIDLGGTKTAVGVVSSAGEVLFSEETPTLSRLGADAILDATAGLAADLMQSAANLGMAIEGIGIGSAGVIDPQSGRVVSATDAIRNWAGTNLTTELSARLALPLSSVRAINDVHAHALGEAWAGAAAGTKSSLLVAFGTGVGGSFVHNGTPLLGHRFVGGHVGHFASPYAVHKGAFLPCVCGGTGHVEAIASGPAVLETFKRLGGDPGTIDTRTVFALAAAGDAAAATAVKIGAAAAGQAVGGLANILDPEAVIVTGGLSGAGTQWWQPMEAALRAELLPALRALPVKPAALGNAAAIIGAAGLILNHTPTSGANQP